MISNSWNRKFWGIVLHTNDRDPMLLGSLWAGGNQLVRYDDEPTRALLFCSRKKAREFCRKRNEYYKDHKSNTLNKWRVKVVRVIEKVEIIE